MSTEEPKACPPKLVKLEKALKLAELWVNNMSGSMTEESTEVEFEGRPSRLGLGAKVMRQSKLAASTDPVERKLRAKLDAEKRRAAKSLEESTPSAGDGGGDDDDDDLESRTNVFTKKRVIPVASSLQGKKKQKRVQ